MHSRTVARVLLRQLWLEEVERGKNKRLALERVIKIAVKVERKVRVRTQRWSAKYSVTEPLLLAPVQPLAARNRR